MESFKQGYARSFKYWITPFSAIGGGYVAWQYLAGAYSESSIAPLIFFALGALFATLISLWFPDKQKSA